MILEVKNSDKRTKISFRRIKKIFSSFLVNSKDTNGPNSDKFTPPMSSKHFEVSEANRVKLLEVAMVQQEMVLDAAHDYYELSLSPWYWGPLSRGESTNLLKQTAYGSFIVRDSETDFSKFTLTFQGIDSNVFNNRINYDPETKTYSFFSGEVFGTIVDLINHAVNLSQNGPYCLSLLDNNGEKENCVENKNVVRLINPLNRQMYVQSLLFLCKAKIRHLLRMHSWNENQNHHFIENSDPVE